MKNWVKIAWEKLHEKKEFLISGEKRKKTRKIVSGKSIKKEMWIESRKSGVGECLLRHFKLTFIVIKQIMISENCYWDKN